MTEDIDIRDKAFLTGQEVRQLNFIRSSEKIAFRKHYRAGLRSHIIEVIRKEDIEKETQGVMVDGILRFPRAKPFIMLRILRNRFDSPDQVFLEIEKYITILKFLGAESIARSHEFIVDYRFQGKNHMILCGLQEYVEGEILDPWNLSGIETLKDLFLCMPGQGNDCLDLVHRAQKEIEQFILRTRAMINASGFIPDLAGVGNLMLTPDGRIKLVDINNIVKISFDDTIFIDDKGYPSLDKSIEVLWLLEKAFLSTSFPPEDSLYDFFLSERRLKQVREFEKIFYDRLQNSIR